MDIRRFERAMARRRVAAALFGLSLGLTLSSVQLASKPGGELWWWAAGILFAAAVTWGVRWWQFMRETERALRD